MSDVYLPILKDTKDPHYRYKMPKLSAKVEGSGNGIKTVVTNMTQVARAIGRPPSYPTKYFGCELGAQVTMTHDLFVVNGAHDAERLLNLLYGFIRKFVLCQKCQNPETTLTVVGQTIRQKCIACGHDTTIPKALHKLTTFIINHPPDGTSGAAGTAAAGSKKNKKSATAGASNNGGHTSPGDESTVISNGQFNADGDFDDFDDEELTSVAYTERMRELTEGFQSGMYLSDARESANVFYQMVKDKRDAGQLGEAIVQKELVKEADRLGIRDKATLILSELLFTERICEEIKQHKILLLRFCHEHKKAQKYLLGGFEKLVGDLYKEQLLNGVAKILKQLYDEDILDEEVILEWSQKQSKKYVSKEMSRKIHEKAAPLVKWLKEAEVEEDSSSEGDDDEEEDETNGQHRKEGDVHHEDEDEEDDDIELEFSHRVSGIQMVETSKSKTVAGATNGASVAANGNQPAAVGSGGEQHKEDDLDIDNI